MKLHERSVEDLHDLALYEAMDQDKWRWYRLFNRVYGWHVWFLVKALRWMR